MDTSALRKKALIFCIILITLHEANGTTTATLNGNPTHLKPLLAITNGSENNNNIDNNNQFQIYDTSAQESIKIENRQLYDTVKHASGYDPDNYNNQNNNSQYVAIKEIEGTPKNNSSSSSSATTTTVRIHPRKSAVIQAIPRKVRGPGGNSHSASSESGTAFLKASPSSTSLQPNAKDYGAGEPTTTIVYATSIPTSMPSRTFVNIRPVPLLSSQKYRSTVVVENERATHHQDMQNTKPVVEHQQYLDDNQQHQQQSIEDQQQQHHQEQKLLIPKKTSLRDNSNPIQSTTTPRTQNAILPSYQASDQQKRNPYKSILYSRIRTNNDEINDEVPSNSRHTFYPNHKWTDEDYMQRRPQQLLPPPLTPLTPASSHFLYENPDPRPDYYNPPSLSPNTYPPASGHAPHQNQHFVRPRYMGADDYQDEMYNQDYDPMTHQQQSMHGLLSQQQQQQQERQYQPLTVRDFDLLLQLLVLREQRLHANHQDPFLPSSSSLIDFNCRNNEHENNYYYGTPKALASSVHEYPNSNFRNREPGKYMQNSLIHNQQQQQQLSTAKLLPSNVREELLFRMLLLALHLQPQTQPQLQTKPTVSRIPPTMSEQHHHNNMYLGSPAPSSPSELSPFLGFRHLQRGAVLKNPVRSVQVLGEID